MSDPSTPAVAEPTTALPDHTQLPDKDGAVVTNFQEHPQSSLLTGCLRPRLQQLRPDGQFAIGQDCGIYFRATQPPLAGCKAPDWFCVLGVPPMLNGQIRRSYVLWNEVVPPLLVIEYVSGDGSEEHDATPLHGKFWVYERGIRAGFYVIFDRDRAILEVYRQNGDGFHRDEPNEDGRFAVPPLGIEFGLWRGVYQDLNTLWLRAWDAATGEMLPSTEEVAVRERQRADTERERADTEQQRAETAEGLLDDTRRLLDEEAERAARLKNKLRELGVDPDAL